MEIKINISPETFNIIHRRCREGIEVADYISEMVAFNAKMLREMENGNADMSFILNELIHSKGKE